jgi:hypothetical protein
MGQQNKQKLIPGKYILERSRSMKKMKTLLPFYCLIGLLLCGAGVLTAETATQKRQTSFEDIVKRLSALENRVNALEERVRTLEQLGAQSKEVPHDKPMLEILSPKNGDEIGMNVLVEGVIRVGELDGRQPVLAVHPLNSNLIWIQPAPISIEKHPEGYEFRCRVYCGSAEMGIGEKYEIFLLLAQQNTLKEGDQLDKLPKNVPVSKAVLVTRK